MNHLHRIMNYDIHFDHVWNNKQIYFEGDRIPLHHDTSCFYLRPDDRENTSNH